MKIQLDFVPRIRVAIALLASAWLILGAYPGGARPARAQSIVRGEIEGVVRDQFGTGIPSVGVTAFPANTEAELFVESTRLGSFEVSMLEAGAYDILFEARGYIPRLVRGLSLRAGQQVSVTVTLTATPSVPETSDTVFASSVGPASGGGEGGRWISPNVIRAGRRDRDMGHDTA
jgi:hypothetical protein